MDNLVVFNEQEVLGKEFKIYGTPEAPLFLAKDVAEWLEMDTSNASRMIKNVDENECITTRHNMTTATFLTEDGLYEVLMQSRKPIAKAFKKEVKVILKSIRKHGAYMTEQTLEQALTSPDFLIQLATQLKTEQEARREAEALIEEQRPKVIFADSVVASDDSCAVGVLAKFLKQNGVDVGRDRLFRWMRENGFLISRPGNEFNTPTQRAMEMKLFEIHLSTRTDENGRERSWKTTRVTAKGQQYFLSGILSDDEISSHFICVN